MFVSVIIPTYNYGQYLPESIGSVLQQTRSPDEIFLVDDGSTDGTADIVRALCSDTRLKYIRIEENRGVSSAKNLGIRSSRGDVIAFLDADDIWRRDKLELQLPLFEDPQVAVVYSLREVFDEKGTLQCPHVRVFRGDVLHALMTHNIVCFSSSIVRRECLEQVGLFDPDLTQAEDFDLWLRIASEGYKFDYVDQALVSQRTGHANASRNFESRFESIQRILTRLFCEPRYKRRVTRRMQHLAWAAFLSKRGYWDCQEGRRALGFRAYLRAVTHDPSYFLAWRGLAKCFLPTVSMLKSF